VRSVDNVSVVGHGGLSAELTTEEFARV
jgi:hypothetical protein